MADRIDVVRDIYQAFAAGDAERLGQLLADTRWVEAEGMPYGGIYHGFGDIAGNVFGPIASDVQGFSAIPDEIIAAGDHRVLALGRYRGTGAGGPLDAAFAHLWTVRDGSVTGFVQYADTHLFRRAIGA